MCRFLNSHGKESLLIFLGPIARLGSQSKFLMVLVDYHSKWFVVESTESVSTQRVVAFMERTFLNEGIQGF